MTMLIMLLIVLQASRVTNGISPKHVLIVNKLRTKPVVDAINTLLSYVYVLRRSYLF